MLHFHLIFVGKTAFPEMDAGIGRYLDRLRHYVPTEVHLVRAEKISGCSADDLVREREGERILKLLEKPDHLLIWDQRGQQLDSMGFARFWDRLNNEGTSKVWMVIGGPLGVSGKLLERANSVFSLSKMTFPHDLARLIVVEQLYRAFSILKGEPYHK